MKIFTIVFLLSLALSRMNILAETNAPCCAKLGEASAISPITEQSIYQIDSTFTDDGGKSVKLSSLAGQPVILTMFFSRCTYACPILANDMKKIETALPAELRGKVRFVLVSFDSDRDTPEALARYRRTRQIPSDWILLTASRDDILELAALLGVKYKKEATGQFAHSNLITLLDPRGEIAFRQTGLNSDGGELTNKIHAVIVR